MRAAVRGTHHKVHHRRAGAHQEDGVVPAVQEVELDVTDGAGNAPPAHQDSDAHTQAHSAAVHGAPLPVPPPTPRPAPHRYCSGICMRSVRMKDTK